jgi:hypothetical protein
MTNKTSSFFLISSLIGSSLIYAPRLIAQSRPTVAASVSAAAPSADDLAADEAIDPNVALELDAVPAIQELRSLDRDVPPPSGGFDKENKDSEAQMARYAHRAEVAFDFARRRPIYKAARVSHVAHGVALRNRVNGHIRTRGVPSGSTVVNSFLFWNLSDTQIVGASTMPALINGNLVQGRKTADNTEPCWGNVGNHSYVANVTPFTNQSGGPNQDYEIGLPFSGASNTSGQNPWSPVQTDAVRLEGATLVVIYRNASSQGSLFLFAPAGDNTFFSSASYTFPNPGAGRGLFTAFGADGQRGFSHNDFASGEVSTFSAFPFDIAGGPSRSGSDWDGDDGLTLPQLWDTHTHEVALQGPSSTVRYTTPGDCIVPVGFVLDQE